MPWQETLLMDQRVQFIADYQRDVFDVADLARRYGISRKTAYKWIDRYDAAVARRGCCDRSRRPAHCPHATPALIVAALLDVRRHHPTWGAKKLLKMRRRRGSRRGRSPPGVPSVICSIARAVIPTSRRRHGPGASGPAADPDDGPQRDLDRGLQRPVQDPQWRLLLSADDRRWLQPVPARVPGLALDGDRRGPADLPPAVPGVRPARHHPDRQWRALRDHRARPLVDAVGLVDSARHPPRADRAGVTATERAP